MYAGVPGMGATDAWHEAAVLLEQHKLQDVGFCGGVADIAIFFDMIVRPLVYKLAEIAGMPKRILTAYTNFLEQMLVLNALEGRNGQAIQTPVRNSTGVPVFNDHCGIDNAAVDYLDAWYLWCESLYPGRRRADLGNGACHDRCSRRGH